MMSKLRIRIFDGSRQLFAAKASFLITITDGNRTQHVRTYFDSNDLTFSLPFFDNFGDNYTVLVYADGHKQAGFTPIKLSDEYDSTLDLMLVPNDPGFNFAGARFADAIKSYPFIAAGRSQADGQAHYDALVESEKPLACLLNLCEAMSQIHLPQGSPLDYIKEIRWDAPFPPAQDRFFAWCDVALIDQVKAAAAAGTFAVENNPGLFHPGATSSWKQIEFGEANVQLTFHENDKTVIDGIDCVLVEPDIDYYQDIAAHALLEVISNALTHSLTDPVQVYVLRWIDGQTAGIPQFTPLYTIT
jgi:hypothetical protein